MLQLAKMTRPVLSTLMVIAAATTPSLSDVADISLSQLAHDSDFVLLGSVKEIVDIQGTPVAIVDVAEMIKGGPAPGIVVLAKSTWRCDISRAVVGEYTLFFLNSYSFESETKNAGSDFFPPANFEEQLAKVAPDSVFTRIAWYGRGRMPITTVEGTAYATVWVSNVVLPDSIATIGGPDERFDRVIRRAPLDDLVAAVRDAVGIDR